MNKFFGHLKTVFTHKYYVFKYACKLGIPIRGFFHDMSKFSPTEFWESVKYWQGNRSPIDACKEENGWSACWLHHKGRNKHHYQYWIDGIDEGGKPIKMPMKYVKEMLADFLGAGNAYSKDKFTYASEAQWWENKKKNCPNMIIHPETKKFIDNFMEELQLNSANAFRIVKEMKDY